nr:hypothetical protein [Tanacetum cinerariifolium]
GERSYWQIIRLGGSFACYQFFVDLLRKLDREDLNQLWALVKEYLSIKPASKQDYPLKRRLALVMISYKFQVENQSQMAEDMIRKIYNIANTLKKQRESSHWQYKFPLPVKVVPTARRLEMPLPGVCTAIEKMIKKLPVKDRW